MFVRNIANNRKKPHNCGSAAIVLSFSGYNNMRPMEHGPYIGGWVTGYGSSIGGVLSG